MVKKGKLSLEELLEQALVIEKDKPHDIPENWVWTRLDSIIKVSSGNGLTSSKMNLNGTIPVYGGNGIAGTHDLWNIEDTTIVIGRVGFYCGCVHLISEKAWVTDNALIVSFPKEYVFIKYLYWLLSNTNLRQNDSSTAQPVISGSKIYGLPIPLAPLSEQQRIVTLIESLFEKLDRAKELVQSTLDSFENRKSAILHKAFTGELTKSWREKNPDIQSADNLLKEIQEEKIAMNNNKILPKSELGETPFILAKNWAWSNLGWLIYKIEAGKNFSCPEIPVTKGNVGLVKISAVTWGKFDCAATKTVTDKSKINKEYFIEKGDFLVSRANTLELVGASVIVDDIEHDIMISDKVWRVKFLKGLELYVNYYLKSTYGRKEIEEKATGNQLSMRNISQDSFRNILLPLPPLEEQQEIVRILDHLLENEQKAKELCDVIDKIDHIKKTILAKAFRGELGTNRPEEESALGLLKEVLQEKAK